MPKTSPKSAKEKPKPEETPTPPAEKAETTTLTSSPNKEEEAGAVMEEASSSPQITEEPVMAEETPDKQEEVVSPADATRLEREEERAVSAPPSDEPSSPAIIEMSAPRVEEPSSPSTPEISAPQVEEPGSPSPSEISAQPVEEPSSPAEVSASQIEEHISPAEVSASQIEEPISPAITEISAQPVEEPGSPSVTEIEQPSSPSIAEISAQPVEEPSSPSITEIEEPISPAITEISAQPVEEPSSPSITEVPAPQIEEPSSPAISEILAPQIEEPTSPSITEVSAPKIEEPSSPAITEVLAPQTEEPGSPSITEIEEPSSPPTAEISAQPVEEPTSPAELSASQIEEPGSPSITEIEEPSPAALTEISAPPVEAPGSPSIAEIEEAVSPIITEQEEPGSPPITEIDETSSPSPTEVSASRMDKSSEVEAVGVARISGGGGADSAGSSAEQLIADEPVSQSAADPHTLSGGHPSSSRECEAVISLLQPSADGPRPHGDLLTMDVFSRDSASSDEDVVCEIKKSPAFSREEAPTARRSVEVSSSPSPDLVQDANYGDEPEDVSSPPPHVESHAVVEERPVSLPDILKSSPLNPDKVDSGSSEGSPDISPAQESPNLAFSPSPNNPFGFDSKVLLLKEMTEETEAKAAEKAKTEPSIAAFDLVKEASVPQKNVSGGETLSPPGTTQEHYDSESPSADSFSPVLDAVVQKPSGLAGERSAFGEEPDAAEEAWEQEVSSEEFEFVERPPRGAMEEFLGVQDSLSQDSLSNPPEMPMDGEGFVEPELLLTEATNTVDAKPQAVRPPDSPPASRGKATLDWDLQAPPAPPAPPPTSTEEQMVSPRPVLELVYWQDVRSSGLVLGSGLLLLLSLCCFSVISVVSYLSLLLLSLTVTFRIYRGVLQAVQKSDEGHPFRAVLERDVLVSEDLLGRYGDVALSCTNRALLELRRLFLVEDLVDSLKLAGLLYVLTYVGALFNGITILILGLITAFSAPIIHQRHQTQIDQAVSVLKAQLQEAMDRIHAALPMAKKTKPE